jgi:hypothetical protein
MTKTKYSIFSIIIVILVISATLFNTTIEIVIILEVSQIIITTIGIILIYITYKSSNNKEKE